MHQPYDSEMPPCPSAECPACSGAQCWLCGAGVSDLIMAYCEHDVIERHRYGDG